MFCNPLHYSGYGYRSTRKMHWNYSGVSTTVIERPVTFVTSTCFSCNDRYPNFVWAQLITFVSTIYSCLCSIDIREMNVFTHHISHSAPFHVHCSTHNHQPDYSMSLYTIYSIKIISKHSPRCAKSVTTVTNIAQYSDVTTVTQPICNDRYPTFSAIVLLFTVESFGN